MSPGTSKATTLRVGTRSSQLARWQTDVVVARLSKQYPDISCEIVTITTGGDKVLDKPISELGTRGVFVKELEEALLADEVDFVVHSLKDLPTDFPEGLMLVSVLCRDDPRDVLVSRNGVSLKDLPEGSKLATSSRRRTAQIKALRNDLVFTDMRGNVPTRVRKMEEGQCDAMILAAAGLLRLEMQDKVAEFLDPMICTPAAGQGALAVECRTGDGRVRDLLAAISEPDVRCEIDCERVFLGLLGGGCSVPIGAYARCQDEKVRLIGCVAALDGSAVFRESVEGPREKASQLAQKLAERMRESGAEEVLRELRISTPNSISAP